MFNVTNSRLAVYWKLIPPLGFYANEKTPTGVVLYDSPTSILQERAQSLEDGWWYIPWPVEDGSVTAPDPPDYGRTPQSPVPQREKEEDACTSESSPNILLSASTITNTQTRQFPFASGLGLEKLQRTSTLQQPLMVVAFTRMTGQKPKRLALNTITQIPSTQPTSPSLHPHPYHAPPPRPLASYMYY